jgi:predicted RNase H-like HicB family nuclease
MTRFDYVIKPNLTRQSNYLAVDLSSVLMHGCAVANRIIKMKRRFTALIKKDEGWWIGWVQEIPGVNSQGKTRAELLKNLRSALKFNREDALAAVKQDYEEEPIVV